MAVLPSELEATMKALEEQVGPLDEREISRAIRAAFPDNQEPGKSQPASFLAEKMAFDFTEDKRENDDQRGTHFAGSIMYLEWPSLQLVTPEIIDYWQARATESRHPVLRARYADLTWDFSPKVRKQNADIQFARNAIETYVEIISRKRYKQIHHARTKAARALALAISINDRARIALVRDTIMALDAAEFAAKSTLAIAFDLLIDNKSVDLSEDKKQLLLKQQETNLQNWVGELKTATSNFTGIEVVKDIALRLAAYYRKHQMRDDVQRVLNSYAEAAACLSGKLAPMLVGLKLRQLHRILVEFGCNDIAENIAVELRHQDERSMEQMTAFPIKIEIPKKDLEDCVQSLLAGTWEEAVERVSVSFIPKRTAVEKQVKNLAQAHPFLSLIAMHNVDAAGRAVANIGTVDDDLEGRVISQISQNMSMAAPILHRVLSQLFARHKIDAEMLTVEILKSPVFQPDRHSIIRRGIKAYFDVDHEVVAHFLIPQIEQALRALLVMCRGSIYKPGRSPGTFHLRILDDLLREPKVIDALTDDVALYLRVTLTDDRGWNLRNNLLHGILPPSQLGYASTDRILHLMLLLGYFRTAPTPPPP